jgi:hypothetical protein
MEITCSKCGTRSNLPDEKIPIGRSYTQCPKCEARINIFKGFPVGALVQNQAGLRFLRGEDELYEEYCEPGELWRVVEVIQPCPDKGTGRACELENKGRCPNQRLILRLTRDKILYKTCLYRKGRRIFDKAGRTPVGKQEPSGMMFFEDDDETYRIR